MTNVVSGGKLSCLRCPCGSGDAYADCCGRFHGGTAVPVSAELLMRSRYSAFCLGDTAYLLTTWHPRTRPSSLDINSAIVWRRLDIVHSERGGLFDNDGIVQFMAHYQLDGEAGLQQETSYFHKLNRRWFYLEAAEESRSTQV